MPEQTLHPARMIAMLLIGSALLLAPLSGCDKNKQHEDERKKLQAEQQQKDEAARAPDKFEASDDPPFNAETRFAAGQLAESQGDFNVAIIQYREALKIDPDHQPTLFRLGSSYTQTKKFDDPIAIWQRYLKVTKHSAAAYNNLAFCYETAGRSSEAEQAYKAGIAKDPNDPACRVNYGLMLARQGRAEEATAQLASVLTPAEVQYNLGSVAEQLGKKDQARAYYTKALELDPKLGDARSRLARLK
jgi:tetratricopeptide (TPR) repeat protein